MTRPDDLATLAPGALDQLMPLHLRIGADGRILKAGPTLARIAGGPLDGAPFLARFEVQRPVGLASVAPLAAQPATRLRLRLRDAPEVALRGLSVPAGPCGGVLVNLSFGISVIDAVGRFGLTNDDFAVTDLAIEMLYLIEAKAAVMTELGSLNDRLRLARAAAEEKAFTDPLTGLANRRALDRVFASVVAAGRPFALMRIDLDFFKEVNDRFGHAAGDAVLAETARRLRRDLREADLVARVGGDEFVLLLPDEADLPRLTALADRLIALLSEPVPHDGADCRISASIGATVSTHDAAPDLDRLMAEADAALYLSKRGGRSRATLVTPALRAAGDLDQVLAAPGR